MIDELLNSINVPEPEKKYLGEDGLYHCSKCHERLQTVIKHPFTGEERKVGIVCSCIKAEDEAYKERERIQERERRRNICFAETNMKGWCFDKDDKKNPKLSAAMKKYADNFKDMEQKGQGLLLFGTVGTGKTFYAACIANALIDEGYHVLMTNFARLTNQIQGMFEGKQQYIDSLNKYALLVIDDLGAERKSEYMQEMVFNIIDSRYRSGLPFIITTNLTAEEIKNPHEIGFQRIYDRIIERCMPIEMSGTSRRRENVKDTYFEVKEKLGL